MQDPQLLQEGLSLMAFGMGFVFVFLTVLVVATTLMSSLVSRLTPAPAPTESGSREAGAADDHDGELMAVISAALHRYRRRR
ncbi:OadG family protein [Aidingimonas halophila]|uniref:Probable oxaloacetate decarboxylase gamma chain n=1 Tax=Aidingimonas halophila TaxID=574349 RepID=A0A1H2VAZ0_9GAMM|nr:OadG family transporter subunit [Aidingimonas halophila]GHC24037.1 hypothetical protein GCM10008094_13710 [Aidingimonas halophila]SDW65487.1 oxaloacetate decarboxylase, gamma subunit [Aidingimonas halophila]